MNPTTVTAITDITTTNQRDATSQKLRLALPTTITTVVIPDTTRKGVTSKKSRPASLRSSRPEDAVVAVVGVGEAVPDLGPAANIMEEADPAAAVVVLDLLLPLLRLHQHQRQLRPRHLPAKSVTSKFLRLADAMDDQEAVDVVDEDANLALALANTGVADPEVEGAMPLPLPHPRQHPRQHQLKHLLVRSVTSRS